MSRYRPHEIELVQMQGTVENVAADHIQVALNIQGRLDLPAEHRGTKVGGIGIYGIDHEIGRLITHFIPAAPVG